MPGYKGPFFMKAVAPGAGSTRVRRKKRRSGDRSRVKTIYQSIDPK